MRQTSRINRALHAAAQADLARIDAQYDAAVGLLARAPYDNHTHSSCTAQRIHIVRESFYAAASLLRAARPGDRRKAIPMLRNLCALQDRRATSRSFGVWPYYAEEPLDALRSPDVNWADFCGNAIIAILADHRGSLPGDLRRTMWSAARRAALAVFRRNVTPDYTNIALMGSVLTLHVGETDGDPSLIAYGREKIAAMEQRLAHHGGFTEYNSPTYTLVAIEELERLLAMVKDPAARASARRLHQAFWQMLADHYHPRTGQFCGPQSRAYQDTLIDDYILFIARRLGAWPVPHQDTPAASAPELVAALPVPREVRGVFLGQQRLPAGTRRQRLQVRADNVAVTSAVWRTPDACLGSVSHGTGWLQARPLLGRLALADGQGTGTIRLRLLANGADFASGEIYTEQHHGDALVLAGFGRNRGSYHLYLDRPEDGMIELRSLVLRFELQGERASVQSTTDGGLLALEQWQVKVRGGGQFKAVPAFTRVSTDAGVVAWEVVWFENTVKRLHFDDLPGASAWMSLSIAGPGVVPVRRPAPRLVRKERVESIFWGGRDPLRIEADMLIPQRCADKRRARSR